MSSNNDSLLEAYLFETNTLLEELDNLVLAAESNDMFSDDDINSIFRIMHTVKGSSAMMEFTSLMTIAHRVEDLFSIIRESSIEVVPEQKRPDLFDLLFQSIDFFRQEIEHLQNSEPLTNNIDNLLQKINSFIQQIQGGGDEPAAEAAAEPAANEAAAANADAQADTDALSCFEPHPDFPFALHVFFDEGSGMENLRALMLANDIRSFCGDDVFTYEPQDLENNQDTGNKIAEDGFMLFFRNAQDRETSIPSVMGSGCVREYQQIDSAPPAEKTKAEAKAEANSAPAQQPKQDNKAAAGGGADNAKPHKESLISVNLSKLDELAAVVGEIVITESMLSSSPDLKGLKLDAFTKSARQLRKLTDELQDVSMSLRMVPVSGTFQKMHRIVRDMCKKLDKDVRLTLVGENTEIDKTIVDSIADPIMHIVRNSMDHGIEETKEDRIKAGKSPTGEILLSARHTGSEVIIEIQDDGRGVEYDSVLAKAIQKGVASPDIEYSNREIINFLMAPGFSTNTEVTEFSGRGVGMDVVKQNVEAVGGTVSITSEPGYGMTTTIKIPLTTAIIDGMGVSVGSYNFTIPIHNIRQSFKIRNEDIIHDASGGEIFKCMDEFYPVVRMRNRYQIEEGFSEVKDGILMWLESENLSYCLFVDHLLGEQQVVFKPLPSFLNTYDVKHNGIAGCTIMGDGDISIILDIVNLYHI